VLRLAWYTADSIRRFDSKTNRTADSIRTKKNDSQVPTSMCLLVDRISTTELLKTPKRSKTRSKYHQYIYGF